MKIHDNYNSFKVQRPVITSGVFDGVHLGHQEILKRVIDVASSVKGESVVVTFWPHPREVLKKDDSLKLINSIEEKLELLEKNGIGHVVLIPFTAEFSKLSSKEYISDILVAKLHVSNLIIGYNHHFGHDRLGDFDQILQYATTYKFTAKLLTPISINNVNISSTLIRKALQDGDIETANKYLGYQYQLSGNVIVGNKIGRTIGYPTANIKVSHNFKIIPKPGVYAIWVKIEHTLYPAMLNIGFRPTLNETTPHLSIEAHIIGFQGDIYGKEITLFFQSRIRDEVKFSGLDQLTKQLGNDREEVTKILGVK